MTRLDEKHNSYFYVTINPNPAKRHNNKRYDNRDVDAQRRLLSNCINKALQWCKHEETMIYYELTKRGNVHAHFKLYLTYKQMKKFQVTINDMLGSGSLAPDICCHVCPESLWAPKVNPETEQPYETWDEYCQKGYVECMKALCLCIKCKLQREDKRTMNLLETGQIDIDFEL